MKRKGFTLLELIIVVIIIGILATMGFNQYQRMVERSRGAEAKAIIGTIRTQAAAHYMQYGTLTTPVFNNERAGIDGASADPDRIPGAGAGTGACATGTHFFGYTVSSANAADLVVTATRCISGGKVPNANSALTLILTSNFVTGSDVWSGTGGY